MRKTTQTVEYVVEGPDEHGRYNVTLPGDLHWRWLRTHSHEAGPREAIKKHIASAPEVVEFEGYLIAPHFLGGYAAWRLDDRQGAENGSGGRCFATSAHDAYQKISWYAGASKLREYIAPTLTLAHFFEQKEEK